MLGGFDLVQHDGEHGLFSPESIDEMCRVADGFGLNVIARVPGIDSSTINSYLDRGVTGIWGPHIETAGEARALVDASLFGPDGQRSWGGGRGNYYNNSALMDIPGGERTEYMRQANANMLVLCQLESARAFENLDAILEVEGIDGYVFGPNDLGAVHGASGAAGSPRRGCRGAPGGGPHSRRWRQAARGPLRGHRAATPGRGRGAAVSGRERLTARQGIRAGSRGDFTGGRIENAPEQVTQMRRKVVRYGLLSTSQIGINAHLPASRESKGDVVAKFRRQTVRLARVGRAVKRRAAARAARRAAGLRLGRVDLLEKIPHPCVGNDGGAEQLVRHWNRLWRSRPSPRQALRRPFCRDRRGAPNPKPRLTRADQPEIPAESLRPLTDRENRQARVRRRRPRRKAQS